MRGKIVGLRLMLGVSLLSGCNSHPQPTDSQPIASPNVTLQGFYRYFADAAVFRDCASGKMFPVSNNGSNTIEVQHRYLQQRKAPGESLFLTFNGHFVIEPSMEPGQMQKAVVIEGAFHFIPGQRCPAEK